ncbi:MAG: DUF2787 family protein [Smithella sp.]
MKMIIRTDSLPWAIDERLRILLQREVDSFNIEGNRGVLLNYRDPDCDHDNRDFHPVEIALDADGSIKCISDFALYGTPPSEVRGESIDFDFGLKEFHHFSEGYHIEEGQDLYKLWEQDFLRHYEMSVYRLVTVTVLR